MTSYQASQKTYGDNCHYQQHLDHCVSRRPEYIFANLQPLLQVVHSNLRKSL